MKNNQKGFAVVEGLLIVVILGIIGYVGWYVYNTAHQEDKIANSAPVSSVKKTVRAQEVNLIEYRNADLGIALSYPQIWGETSLKDGVLVSPQHGNYKTLSFSAEPKTTVDFVMGPYGSPLDGCVDPLFAARHNQYGDQASVIGWDSTNLKGYYDGQGFDGPTVYKMSLAKSDTSSGWTTVTTNDKVLVYKNIDDPQNRVKPSNEDNGCSVVTQAQADEANAFDKIYHFAANYSNSTVYGVNAQFDARSADSSATRGQIVDVLNSLKDN